MKRASLDVGEERLVEQDVQHPVHDIEEGLGVLGRQIRYVRIVEHHDDRFGTLFNCPSNGRLVQQAAVFERLSGSLSFTGSRMIGTIGQ